MVKVSLTIPKDLVTQAKSAGLNMSGVASAALKKKLEEKAKTLALQKYLEELDQQHGPLSQQEMDEASQWADQLDTSPQIA